MNKKRVFKAGIVLGFIVFVALLFRFMGWSKFFTLQGFQQRSAEFKVFVDRYYWYSVLVFLLSYVFIIAIALPVVAPLTLLGGYLFGTLFGFTYSLIGSTLGACLSFLFIRFIFKNIFYGKHQKQLDQFKQKIHQYGYTYLLSLQLMTVVPFFIINTFAALADVPFLQFLWTTAVGCAPLLMVYSYAGKQLAEIKSVSDIVKPSMILLLIALAMLSLLPMIIKRLRHKFGWEREETQKSSQ